MKEKKSIVILGIFVSMLATTYASYGYIATYLYKHMGPNLNFMGPLLLASNYSAYLIANSFAPSLTIKMKNQLLIAALFYTINYAVQMLGLQKTAFGVPLSVCGSAIGGVGSSIVWICYGSYTRKLCVINQEQDQQGQYFALLGLITFTSSIFGPLITTFAFGLFSAQVYFTVLTIVGLIAIAFCFFFVKDINQSSQSQEERIFNCSAQFIRNVSYYIKMKSIIGCILLDGLVLGFISSSVTKIMGPSQKQEIKVGIFLIILGVGSMIGSFCSGLLSDYISMKNVGRLIVVSIFFTCVLSLIILNKESIALAYMCGFIWGFNLQFIEGWMYVVCSRNLNGALPCYANVKQLHSIVFCLYQAYLILSSDALSLEYPILGIIVLTIPAIILINFLPTSEPNDAMQQEIELEDI